MNSFKTSSNWVDVTFETVSPMQVPGLNTSNGRVALTMVLIYSHETKSKRVQVLIPESTGNKTFSNPSVWRFYLSNMACRGAQGRETLKEFYVHPVHGSLSSTYYFFFVTIFLKPISYLKTLKRLYLLILSLIISTIPSPHWELAWMCLRSH